MSGSTIGDFVQKNLVWKHWQSIQLDFIGIFFSRFFSIQGSLFQLLLRGKVHLKVNGWSTTHYLFLCFFDNHSKFVTTTWFHLLITQGSPLFIDWCSSFEYLWMVKYSVKKTLHKIVTPNMCYSKKIHFLLFIQKYTQDCTQSVEKSVQRPLKVIF